jgi:hypothetical protein
MQFVCLFSVIFKTRIILAPSLSRVIEADSVSLSFYPSKTWTEKAKRKLRTAFQRFCPKGNLKPEGKLEYNSPGEEHPLLQVVIFHSVLTHRCGILGEAHIMFYTVLLERVEVSSKTSGRDL